MTTIHRTILFKKTIAISILLMSLLLITSYAVLAHEDLTVGDYTMEYGWMNEPSIAGQPNAVVVNITSNISPSQEVDVSGLVIQAVYGGQAKVLTLQPLGEDTPGQFIAPITPMLPGKYTIHIGGNIGSTAFNTDVQPEEVQTQDTVQFPVVAPSQDIDSNESSFGVAGWLGIVGIVFGVIGTLLGGLNLIRKTSIG